MVDKHLMELRDACRMLCSVLQRVEGHLSKVAAAIEMIRTNREVVGQILSESMVLDRQTEAMCAATRDS